MSAQIYIKRRKEPMTVSENRAKKLKRDWLVNPKSTDIIDLGEWSGELSQVVSIELFEREVRRIEKDPETEKIQYKKTMRATPIKQRAKMLARFKLAWYMRSGITEKEPPAEIMEKAEKLAFDYYTKNPNEVMVDPEVFEPLLFARFGVKNGAVSVSEKLSEKMVVAEPKIEDTDIPF